MTKWDAFYRGWVPLTRGGKERGLALVLNALQGVRKGMIEYEGPFVEVFLPWRAVVVGDVYIFAGLRMGSKRVRLMRVRVRLLNVELEGLAGSCGAVEVLRGSMLFWVSFYAW